MHRLTPASLIPNSGSGINTLNVVRKPCDSSFQIECFSREGVPPKDVVPSKERSVSLECHRRKGVTPKVPVDPGPGLWGTAREGKGRFHTSILDRFLEAVLAPSLINAFIYAIN